MNEAAVAAKLARPEKIIPCANHAMRELDWLVYSPVSCQVEEREYAKTLLEKLPKLRETRP